MYILMGFYTVTIKQHFEGIYHVTHMHSADYAVARCLSVRPSERPSATRRY